MKTIITTDLLGQRAIVNFLTEFLPTMEESKEIEKTYSLGFTRLSKLSSKKRIESFKALYFEGYTNESLNTEELKRRLKMMSEEEFRNFKRK